jgi:uracil-DNA glycosylase family 4
LANDQEWLDEAVSNGKMSSGDASNWENLRNRISGCTGCGLHATCSHRVFGVGNPKAPFLFVGEAPGVTEDRTGEPFTGKSGLYLRKVMKEVGFKRGDVYITNCVRCRPPANRPPTKEEIGSCLTNLIAQLDMVKPRVVVAVGAVALKSLCPHSKQAVGSCRGDPMSGYGYTVVPVWHPAFILRAKSSLRAREFYKDLRKAFLLVFSDGGK